MSNTPVYNPDTNSWMAHPHKPQPMSEAPRYRPFLVWHAGEWRVVRLDCNTDDLVFTSDGKLWTARCWWPLPADPTTNEGQL